MWHQSTVNHHQLVVQPPQQPVLNHLSFVTDKEEQPEPHQKANERVHGVVADRA